MKSLTKILIIFVGCIHLLTPSKAQQSQTADSLFSEGLNYMNSASDYSAKGDLIKRKEYNQKAIDKFNATLQINNNYAGAKTAVAHCYFESQQYKEAVEWYKSSLMEDSTVSTSLAEMGLAYIYLGNADTAARYIRSAARHDTDEKFTKSLATKIVLIAEKIQGNAFEIGKKDADKSIDLYWIATKILIVAFDLDPYRNEIAKNISDLGFRLNDYDIASKYLQLSVR